jgi:HK97 family phage portal protein
MANVFTRVWRSTRMAFKSFSMVWSGQGGGEQGMADLFRFGRSTYDYRRDIVSGRDNSIVMSVVGWIAHNFPQAELQVVDPQDDGTFNVQPSHELVLAINRPNPYYSGEALWIATLLDLMTSGNAYWLIVKGAYNTLGELWYTPQQLLRPRWNENGNKYIEWYDYTPDPSRADKIYKVPVEDVIHFRDGIDPNNTRLGLSKLRSIMREIWTDDEAANFSAALLRNHAIPGVIISPGDDESEFGQEDADALKIQYIGQFGNDGRGEPMVVSAPIKVEMLSFSPEQMNLVKMRRIPEERISAVYGVNAIVAGLGVGLEHSTFRNYKEARAAAYEECVLPLQKLIAAELTRSLLPLFATSEEMQVRFDVTKLSIFQEDAMTRARMANMLVTGGWVTVGAGMRIIGMPADTTYDYYLRRSGLQPVPLAEAGTPAETVVQPALGPPKSPLTSETEEVEQAAPKKPPVGAAA